MEIGAHNGGEMLLHADTVKSSNFFQGKPSDEANQINEGMAKTFMTFTRDKNDSDIRAGNNDSEHEPSKDHLYSKKNHDLSS